VTITDQCLYLSVIYLWIESLLFTFFFNFN